MRLTTLTTLVVLFVAAVTLAMTIPRLWLVAQRESARARDAAADAVAADLARIDVRDSAAVQQLMPRFARAYSVSGIVIDAPAPNAANSRERRVGSHLATIYFDSDGRLAAATRNALVAATAAAVAALIFGAISLFELLAFVRENRTRDAMPSGENQHLIQTMQSSIAVMRGREQELRRLHDRAQERAGELATITATLVRSLTSGFISVDGEGRVVDMNQPARDLLRYTGSAAGIAPRDAFRAVGRFASALQDAVDRRAAVQRTEIEEDDGTVVGLTTVPLLDDSGRHFGMLALFVDLTPVRRLENRLRQMQSLADLGEMSAGIAHEFRNSLSTILGYLRLARKATPPQAIDQTIARAEAEARELSTAVDSLLTFTRPLQLQTQSVDLAALVSSIAERLRGLNERVSVSVHAQPVVVSGDPALLARAFENLIRNAYEAVGGECAEPRIDIRIESDPAPLVTIADNGSGIAAEQASRLFVPFQSTKPSGFGLGLAMARKIVLLHGGVVTLESGIREGAVATVRLPAAEGVEAAPEELARYFS